MELILTSFGLSHIEPPPDDGYGIFYRMIPVSMTSTRHFLQPDYAVLLLCNRLVMDTESFERLVKSEHEYGYTQVAAVTRVLYDEGFVRLVDFNTIVQEKRPLLERMLERDLKILDLWVKPMEESMCTWAAFAQSFEDGLRERSVPATEPSDHGLGGTPASTRERAIFLHELGHHKHASWAIAHDYELLTEAIRSARSRRRSQHRDVLRRALTGYLAYVNANLVISRTLGLGFHDWSDFAPFYSAKFESVGQEERPGQGRIEKVKQLFEVAFPEFAAWNPKTLVRALRDPRIVDLRLLVEKSVREEIEFDVSFARRILAEVVEADRRVERTRRLVSLATLPLALIPRVGTVVQKGVDEVALRVAEADLHAELRWFYLISELGSSN